MNNISSIATRLSKNPLGIIALAFVFVYAIAGLFTSQTDLVGEERLLLIVFLILFPCLVLYVFYLLVTGHHTKLYSPSDFTDENNFLKAIEDKMSNLENITERIQAQIDNQPLYRYTKLKEPGKILVLSMYKKNSFEFLKLCHSGMFKEPEIREQVKTISEYGWCTIEDNNIIISKTGVDEIGTFQDICYGRMS